MKLTSKSRGSRGIKGLIWKSLSTLCRVSCEPKHFQPAIFTSHARHGAPLPGPVGGRSLPASARRTWVEALSSALDLEPPKVRMDGACWKHAMRKQFLQAGGDLEKWFKDHLICKDVSKTMAVQPWHLYARSRRALKVVTGFGCSNGWSVDNSPCANYYRYVQE